LVAYNCAPMNPPRQPKQSIVIGDAEYLKALSGAKQRGAVRDWCRKNGIKTFNNRDGWPVTTDAALDRALTGTPASEPDWSYFDLWKTSPHWRHKRLRAERGIPEPPTNAPATPIKRTRTKTKS
jgi:hypothetical protein